METDSLSHMVIDDLSRRVERHLPITPDSYASFGNGRLVTGYDFHFWVRGSRIGVSPRPSSEAESFVMGFLVQPDSLSVIRVAPGLFRDEPSYAALKDRSRSPEAIDVIEKLIGMFHDNEVVHAYNSLAEDLRDGWKAIGETTVLTFSHEAPPNKMYRRHSPMPFRLE
jgi:hypothetical protein